MTLKEELPRLGGANMLLEISGEITPERMKRQSQSKNNTQMRMSLVMEESLMLQRARLHRDLEC